MATVIDIETPTEATATTQKTKKQKAPRGYGYTPAEDIRMEKAWIAVSENHIVGAEQKGNDFFTSITTLYNDKLKPSNREMRTVESVKARCKAIQKDCMLFSGCHARIVRSKPTGVSSDDIIHMTTGLFNDIEMRSVADDCGKPFRFLQAWYILRDHENFTSALTISPKPNDDGHDAGSEVAGGSDENVVVFQQSDKLSSSGGGVRPVGRKRTKEQQQKQKEAAKKLKLAAESVAAQVERNVVLKRHYEIALFTSAPDGCDASESLEYFRIMRSRALNSIRKEEKETQEEAPDNEIALVED